MHITQQEQDAIRTIITFLIENEQFGDDWGEEIACLDSILAKSCIESDSEHSE